MKRTTARRNKLTLCLCVVVVPGFSGQALADLLFRSQSSTLSITHDLNALSSTDVPVVRSIAPVPAASTIYPNSAYQHNRILSSGTSSSQAAGSLGHVTNPSMGSFQLATGTGITQVDPTGALGASSLKFDVDLRWSITTGGLGPVSTGFSSITTGVKVGTGGRADLKINLQFLDGNNVELRSPWRLDAWWSSPGTYTNSFTTSDILGQGLLTEGQTLRIKGTIEFLANNEVSPTSILPLAVETGFTPPTATFIGEGEINWSDQKNWADPEPGNPGLRKTANGVGQRARFLASDAPRKIKVDKNIQIGALDINGDKGHEFLDDGKGGRLTFKTNSKVPGVLSVRNNSSRNSNLEVGAPPGTPADTLITSLVELDADLDIEQHTNGALNLDGKITGRGGVTKRGKGLANLAGNNDFLGDVIIEEGKVNANAHSSMGRGTVKVRGGQLGYNANGAATNVLMESGLLDLGVIPNSQDKFDIRGRSSIKGSSAELAGLIAGNNITLEEDTWILHDDDGGGTPAGLGTVPKYIFGVTGNNLANLTAIVGAESSSPWKSFGSQADITSVGAATSGALDFRGTTQLITEEFGILRIYAPISSTVASPGSEIRKLGFGITAINNVNTLTTPLRIQEGTVYVNGYLPANVTVESGQTIGGTGQIDGDVALRPGDASISPGSPVGTQTTDQPVFIGTLTVNSLTLADQSLLDFDLGTLSDRIRVNGDLTLDGVVLVEAFPGFGPGQYALFEYAGSVDDQGLQFGTLPEGFLYSYSIYAPIFDEETEELLLGTVVLNVEIPVPLAVSVPEPAALGMLALGALALVRRRQGR